MTHPTTTFYGLHFDWWQCAIQNRREHDRYILFASLAIEPEDRAFALGMAEQYLSRAVRCAENAMEEER